MTYADAERCAEPEGGSPQQTTIR